jgi:hypothetical protein
VRLVIGVPGRRAPGARDRRSGGDGAAGGGRERGGRRRRHGGGAAAPRPVTLWASGMRMVAGRRLPRPGRGGAAGCGRSSTRARTGTGPFGDLARAALRARGRRGRGWRRGPTSTPAWWWCWSTARASAPSSAARGAENHAPARRSRRPRPRGG